MPSSHRWVREATRCTPGSSALGSAVAALYLAFLIWMHAHHEMWRDEVHAWSLARIAQGFGDLVTGDRRYEGHPPLWFWYLRVWSWIVPEVWGLQVATVAAAVGAAVVLLRFAPFPRYLKLLLLLTYDFGYELSVMLPELRARVAVAVRVLRALPSAAPAAAGAGGGAVAAGDDQRLRHGARGGRWCSSSPPRT